MIKLLIGGSPCTYWSIAQKNNRETEASGIGWELFKNYLIAKEKFQPDYFLYENNKSAATPIKCQIKKELGVDGNGSRYIEINSALVSAQNRQRFYVHNCGTVQQPKDRGILLRDILQWSQESLACEGASPVAIGWRGRPDCGKWKKRYEAREDMKANALTTVVTDSMAAEPVQVGAMPRPNGELSTSQAFRVYSVDAKSVTQNAGGGGAGGKGGLYAVPIKMLSEREVDYMFRKEGRTEYGYIQNADDEKAKCITANISKGVPYNVMFQHTDGKQYPVYEVKDGKITIKGKQYPIKLADGFYIIRKLTVAECARLQTMPDDYCRAVSDSQAYKGLGNGWTAEVIIHILNHALKDVPKDEEILVLSMYDGIGTGRYCLDKMGFTNVKYYAYEIDKYAMQIAKSNYPDIIECGDAFKLREDAWEIGY